MSQQDATPAMLEAMNELGLAMSRVPSGRAFSGTYRDHAVRIALYRRTYKGGGMTRRYIGTVVEIRVETPAVNARATVGVKTNFSEKGGRLFGRNPVETGDAAFDEFVVFGKDEAWTRELVTGQGREAVLDLVAHPENLVSVTLNISPGAVVMTSYRIDERGLPPQQVLDWLDRMVTVAEAVKEMPEPYEKASANYLEKAQLEGRQGPVWLTACGVMVALVGIFGLLGLCFAGALMALAYVM